MLWTPQRLTQPNRDWWARQHDNGGGGTTTFDSGHITAGCSLTNGDLTYTHGGGAAYKGTRSLASASSGKKYHELHVDNVTSANPEVGIGTSSAAFTSFLGTDTNSVGWIADGRIFINSVNVTNVNSWDDPNTLCIATDLDNNKIWFRVNGGNWNNDGSANPATNTNGIDISGLAAGAKFAIVQSANDTDAYTANFGGSSYAQTAPSGFGNW